MLTRRQAASGVTLIELAVVIAIMAVVAGFATLTWAALGENRDATLVQATQANLQTVISQGALRLDKSPATLLAENGNDIQNAVRALMQDGDAGTSNDRFDFSVAGNTAILRIEGNRRTATYQINNQTGDVTLQAGGLGGSPGWSQYVVQNGVITKN